MAGKFDNLLGVSDSLKGFRIPEVKIPSLPTVDNRSRSEWKEDFEQELKALDKNALIELRDKIQSIDGYSDSDESDFWKYKEDIENSIIKLIRYMNKFDDLNSEESRKIAIKEQELRIEAKHDWLEKTRLFIFRVLATVLFIASLFTIGYIEHKYEWARLPLSKYVNSTPLSPAK